MLLIIGVNIFYITVLYTSTYTYYTTMGSSFIQTACTVIPNYHCEHQFKMQAPQLLSLQAPEYDW